MRETVDVLVDKYKNNLFVAAFNVCQSIQDAEDVVQESFLQYISVKKQFESEQHIRAWLFRVAINKAKNKNRSFFKRNVFPLEDDMEAVSFASPESSDVFEAVMGLPEKYRIVIHLFYYEDYTGKEIADVLKITESNVKARLSRGRRMLKMKLREGWEDDE